jgi:hypothetical protein
MRDPLLPSMGARSRVLAVLAFSQKDLSGLSLCPFLEMREQRERENSHHRFIDTQVTPSP